VTGPDRAGYAHQPGDVLAAVSLALGPQRGMNPRCPVGVARGNVDILQPRDGQLVSLPQLSERRRPHSSSGLS